MDSNEAVSSYFVAGLVNWFRLGLLPSAALFIWPDFSLAQMTLQEAVELATKHQKVDPGITIAARECKQQHFRPSQINSLTCTATTAENVLPLRLCVELPVGRTSGDNASCNASLNAAVTYVELTVVNAQLDAVKQQGAAATRLLEIETKRVVERVDDPVRLLRAKLMSAKTRLRAAELQTSAVSLREDLAALTGVTADHVEPEANSIPVFESDATGYEPEISSPLTEALGARDVAQLEYVLAHEDRMGTNAKILEGTSNLGDLVSAYINEKEKFSVLLGVNSEVQHAQLLQLYLREGLDNWVLGEQQGLTKRGKSNHDIETKPPIGATEKSKGTRTVRTLMITPGTAQLIRGASQQFSAIAIYDDGTARDETLHAVWLCSSNSAAIVSKYGLVTALSTAQFTVTAKLNVTSQERKITIKDENPVFLNP